MAGCHCPLAVVRVVPNDLKRYNFNSYSPLKSEADGSLKIGVGPKPLAGAPESNSR